MTVTSWVDSAYVFVGSAVEWAKASTDHPAVSIRFTDRVDDRADRRIISFLNFVDDFSPVH